MVAEMAARLRSWNSSLLEVLDDLATEYGVHATRQVSVRVTDTARIQAVMTALRDQPPTTVAGIEVTSVEDLAAGAGGLPPTDGLRIQLASGGRIIVRPSGTEPKVKCYLQCVRSVDTGSLDDARADAEAELQALTAEVERWLQ
jgi:phosphomannomutase